MNSFKGNSKFSEGFISEIFASIQGEGVYCGTRQIFIRFTGCNLRCAYCDTKASHSNPQYCNVEMEPGTFRFLEEPNPVTPEILFKHINRLSRYHNHSIALTGGEPLLQGNFLRTVLPDLKSLGHTIYLETNGTQSDQLKQLLPYIDIISMDIKLPSVAKLGDLWFDHEDFLKLARECDLFVKIILGNVINPLELEKACKMIARIAPNAPLILQPLTQPDGKMDFVPLRFMEMQQIAMDYLADVRIIPQVHKLLGNIL